MEKVKTTYTGALRRELSEIHRECSGIPDPRFDAVHRIRLGMSEERGALADKVREICVFSLLYMMKVGEWPSRPEIALAFRMHIESVDFFQEKIINSGLKIYFREG